MVSINLATATPTSSGFYALTVPAGLSAGSNVLTVAYSGDSNYGASTATATLAVNNDSLSLSYGTLMLAGVNYTVSVAINGALVNNTARTGTLSLVEGTTTLASLNVATTSTNSFGDYTLNVPGGLPIGTYSNLKVTYSGDATYSALSSPLGTVTVSNDLLTLGNYTTQTLIGQPYSLGAAIVTASGSTAKPTGTLTLSEGTTTLATLNLATATLTSSGFYTLSIPAGLPAGANVLKVAYSGDANYAAASSQTTVTGVTIVSTSVGLSWTNPLAGQAFTMNADINPTAQAGFPHTGTLTLSENGSILASVNLATSTPSSSGYYALTVPAGLPVGNNTLIVSYSGDANYATSTATASVTVTGNDNISWSYATSALVGVNYTVNVEINGALVNNTPRTGTLSLIEGTTTLASINVGTTAPGSNGYYALTVPGGLPAGTYSNLKVTYSGDANYSPISSLMGTVTVSNDVLALSYASSQSLVGQPFWLNVAIQTGPGSTAGPDRHVDADRRDDHAGHAQPGHGHAQQHRLLHVERAWRVNPGHQQFEGDLQRRCEFPGRDDIHSDDHRRNHPVDKPWLELVDATDGAGVHNECRDQSHGVGRPAAHRHAHPQRQRHGLNEHQSGHGHSHQLWLLCAERAGRLASWNRCLDRELL